MSSSEWHKIIFRSNERRFMGIASRKAKRGKSMRWRMLNLTFKIFAKKNTIHSLVRRHFNFSEYPFCIGDLTLREFFLFFVYSFFVYNKNKQKCR